MRIAYYPERTSSVKGENIYARTVGNADGALTKSAESGIIVTDKQFGKKIGKHAKDYNLDPSKPEDRDTMNEIITDLIVNNDYYTEGKWRGQEGTCAFYFKGDDVVIVNIDKNEFVTIMEGGLKNNAGIKKIRGKEV